MRSLLVLGCIVGIASAEWLDTRGLYNMNSRRRRSTLGRRQGASPVPVPPCGSSYVGPSTFSQTGTSTTCSLAAGTYTLLAQGANGGESRGDSNSAAGGLGASGSAHVTFSENTVVTIVVGSPGEAANGADAPGGGGGLSAVFIVEGDSLYPLVVGGAGGGGSINSNNNPIPAVAGGNASPTEGSSPQGGTAPGDTFGGGAGAGLNGVGSGSSQASQGGQTYPTYTGGSANGASEDGGYGGGGGVGVFGGGGGGGYSGGAGGDNAVGAGGGTCYAISGTQTTSSGNVLTGTSPTYAQAAAAGPGMVTIMA